MKQLIYVILFCGLVNCSGINTMTSKNSMTYTEIGDLFLNDQIKVDDIKVVETENGKSWNVSIKNLMWFDINLEVKMDFYDADGIKVDNPWGWKPLTLEKAQGEWVKFTAPNKSVRNFKLLIKKAG